MQTYKYVINAKTGAASIEQLDAVKEQLEQKLISSPDCLMAYAMFPTDSDILEHVDMNIEGGSLESITLNTYSKLWEGREDDLFSCVNSNLIAVHNEQPELPIIELPEYTGIDRVKFLGREGTIPDKLYHIAEAEDLKDISRDGIVPNRGPNSWKDDEPHTYLTDEKNLPAWLSVLPHLKEPVVLEIDTSTLKVEYARHYSDREYLPNGYEEYRTAEYIPAEDIKEADLGHGSNELATRIRGGIMEQLENTTPDSPEFSEVSRGLDHLIYMGLMKEEQVQAMKASRAADIENAAHTADVQGQKLWKYQFDMENIKPDEVGKDTTYSPLNVDMAPYESSRFEEILKASKIPGRSNIDGVKFEPNPDGSVDRMNVYMKNALTKDMEQRTAAFITDKIVPEFNEQSDDVKIRLGDMKRIGKVDASDKNFKNDFGDMLAEITEKNFENDLPAL